MFTDIVKFVDLLGAIPVVVGAPNIQDFAPLPGSILHIKEKGDIDSVAKTMTYLADNPDAYNQSLRWVAFTFNFILLIKFNEHVQAVGLISN